MFIVVCNNTNVSKAVFDYIAGYETEHRHPDGAPVVAPGAIALFNNVKDQRWLHRPNTILVDSRQLESGESMSDDFKKLAAHQIEDFKAEYRRRFPTATAPGSRRSTRTSSAFPSAAFRSPGCRRHAARAPEAGQGRARDPGTTA